MSERVLVCAMSAACDERARTIAGRVGGVLVAPGDVGADALVLRVDRDGLTLAGDGMELRPDLTRMMPRVRPGALSRELLVRAARMRGVDRPRAVDATAGLGEDSLLLAAAGFEVELFERDPVIAVLLEDAVARAREDAGLASIALRMHVHAGDSAEALARMGECDDGPDVVYLDPMFPGRTKSAAVKKKFQLLHHLEHPCDDEEALMTAALAARPRKIVVKRPVKGPYLAGVKPSHSVAGKAVRYDCIVVPRA